MAEPREIARSVFDEARSRFPDLAVLERESGEDSEPELQIPAQDGLSFEITLYLFDDVLNLCAGHFWGEWFPCRDPAVVARYLEAVEGLLAGRYRVVEHTRNGEFIRAYLQRPAGTGWKSISRHYHRLALPWWGTTVRVLQNVAA